MAEINTVIAEASQDLQTIEDFVNLPAGSDVRPRLLPSVNVGTLAGARQAIFEAGGLPATPFATKALMTASALVDGDYAMVTDDTVNNGLYIKTAGAWVRSDYSPLMQSIADSNALFKPRTLTTGEDLDNLTNGFYRIPSIEVASSLVNLPTDMTYPKIGYLFVFKENSIAYQHLVHYSKTEVEEYKRVSNGSSVSFAYKEWQKELELSDINTLIAASNKISYGFLANAPQDINFDHVNRNVVITNNTVRVVHGKTSSLLPAQTLAYPANGTFKIVYNKTANNLSWVAAAIATTDDQIVVGAFVESYKTIIGIDSCLINGAPRDKVVFTGTLLGNPQDINFDFVGTGKLLLTAFKTRVLSGNATTLLSAKELVLPLATDGYWYRIVYVVATGVLSLKNMSVALTGDEIVLGYIQGSSQTILGIDSYYVNGSPTTVGKSDLLTSELIIVNGDTDASYRQPVLPSYKTFLTTNTQYTAIYALYDALMATYPTYVTKTLLGNDAFANPIYQYDFKEPDVTVVNQSGNKAKIVMVSGVHGMEKAGIYTLYLAMKEICERWESDSKLETLHWECHFRIVPISVPTGFNRDNRKNEAGVDIARNFATDWELNDVSLPTHGGTAPMNQKETQILDKLMADNKDCVYFGSFHNFGLAPETEPRFLWVSALPRFTCRLGKSLIARLHRTWLPENPWIAANYDGYIGFANTALPNGSECRHSAKAHSLQSGVIEISANIKKDGVAGDVFTSEVATLGTEAIINWFLLNLEYGSELYNSKVRL